MCICKIYICRILNYYYYYYIIISLSLSLSLCTMLLLLFSMLHRWTDRAVIDALP